MPCDGTAKNLALKSKAEWWTRVVIYTYNSLQRKGREIDSMGRRMNVKETVTKGKSYWLWHPDVFRKVYYAFTSSNKVLHIKYTATLWGKNPWLLLK